MGFAPGRLLLHRGFHRDELSWRLPVRRPPGGTSGSIHSGRCPLAAGGLGPPAGSLGSAEITPALEIVKSVHSAFLGTPDLHAWLARAGLKQLVITGIQTNRCCETTARAAGDLGYDVLFALDATHTFDEKELSADQLAAATAVNIDGHFGRVVRTADLIHGAVG
jgi:nicotinamidase-related amidase